MSRQSIVELIRQEAYQRGKEEKCDKCEYFVEVEEASKKSREDTIDEITQAIHNIYIQDLYCKEDLCEAETKGYSCEDCLFTTISDSLNHLKEQKE